VFISATRAGSYTVRVRTLADNEPVGRYRLTVVKIRDAAATRGLADERRRIRQEAVDWLAARSMVVPAVSQIDARSPLKLLDEIAERSRVMGLGEATHGSREFADFRLATTKRLVERNGYRVIAVELSAQRTRDLAGYVNGDGEKTDLVRRALDFGWFGRRSFAELVEWARTWNAARPTDRVQIVGVDAQGFVPSLDWLEAFVGQAYGEAARERWIAASAELRAADEQTAVFGNSDVSGPTRSFAIELYTRLRDDETILKRRLPAADVDRATAVGRDLAQFADFNGGEQGLSQNRDWYMALNVIQSLNEAPAASKIVFWAHNAHVAHSSVRYKPSGTILRSALGCEYTAIGGTFDRGGFIAQIPGNPKADLAVTILPPANDEVIDSAVADVARGTALITWPCNTGVKGVPSWLTQPRPMRWVGGIYVPGGAPSTATRTFTLTTDFDGVFFIPEVTAEEIPTDRPVVPPRSR
jgi:erythromycin esterase